MEVIVAGDHQPVAIADRPDVRALEAIEDPHELLRAMVRAATPILARLNVIYPCDVDAKKAADILWTVLSPDTYHSLVIHRGWSVTDFEEWATDTLVATLTNKIHDPDD